VIAEIGWPSADDGERTTVDNEKTNFDTTKAFLLGPGNFALDAYWFEAFDEWWKPAEGNPPKPLGPHWGMFTGGDSFGEPKWKPVPTGR